MKKKAKTYRMAEVVDGMSFPKFARNNLKIVTMQGKLEYLNINRPQQLVHSILEEQRAAGLPMRAIVLKARRDRRCGDSEIRMASVTAERKT